MYILVNRVVLTVTNPKLARSDSYNVTCTDRYGDIHTVDVRCTATVKQHHVMNNDLHHLSNDLHHINNDLHHKLFVILVISLIILIEVIMMYTFVHFCFYLTAQIVHSSNRSNICCADSAIYNDTIKGVPLHFGDILPPSFENVFRKECKGHDLAESSNIFSDDTEYRDIPLAYLKREKTSWCNNSDIPLNSSDNELEDIGENKDISADNDEIINEIRRLTWLPLSERFTPPSSEQYVYFVPQLEIDSGDTASATAAGHQGDASVDASETASPAPEPTRWATEAVAKKPWSLEPILDQMTNGHMPPPQETMKHELLRLCTLRNYPKENKPYLTKIARAGFYYAGKQDEVVCYSCGLKRQGWTADDDPMHVHQLLTPNCSFLTRNSTVNVPIPDVDDGHTDRLSAIDAIPEPNVNEPMVHRQEDTGVASNVLRAGWANSSPGATMSHRRDQTTNNGQVGGRGQDIRRTLPKHPQYALKASRLATFVEWSQRPGLTKEDMADCGLYFGGFSDCVRCFSCGIGLRNWEDGDHPWTEHARWSKDCVFLRAFKGADFIDRVQAAAALVESQNQGVSTRAQEDMRRGSNSCSEDRLSFNSSTGDSLQLQAGDTPNTCTSSETSLRANRNQSQKSTEKTHRQSAVVENCKKRNVALKKQTDTSKKMQKLKAENNKLKSQSVCHVCGVQENCIVYLPCAHLVSCSACAVTQKNCGICGQYIKGTVRTYSA